MIALFSFLLACQAPPGKGLPIDTGSTDVPTWSGTQIGEEGDVLCSWSAVPWTAELAAESPWDPETLSAQLGRWSGRLSSTGQGEADLTIETTAAGDPLALIGDKEDLCPVGLRIPVTLTFSAPPLLDLTTAAHLDATEAIRLDAALAASEITGELSAGTLPDDAVALELWLWGLWEEGWSGEGLWHLERTSGTETAPAAAWSAE